MSIDTKEGMPNLVKEQPINKEAKKEAKKAKRLLNGEKLRLILQDEECKQALYACLRTLANTGVSIIDLVPGLGEIPSWAADGVKVLKMIRAKNIERKRAKNKKVGKESDRELNNFWARIDISPDVPWEIAVGSEVIDVAAGTTLPSHAVETTMQLRHDLPRIKAALKKIKEIWGASTVEELRILTERELKDYQDNKEEIDLATAAFTS